MQFFGLLEVGGTSPFFSFLRFPSWAATALPSSFLATAAHVASLWPFAVPHFLVHFAGKGRRLMGRRRR